MSETIDIEQEDLEVAKAKAKSQAQERTRQQEQKVERDPLLDFKQSAPAPKVEQAPQVAAKVNNLGFGQEEQAVSNAINKASLGPGIILKNMREDAKLTIEDVAGELKLATRHIAYLEADQFEKFTALAFYIGYLRNYSRLLNLDSEKMVAKFYAVYKVKPDVLQVKPITVKNKLELKDRWPFNKILNNPYMANKNTRTLVTGLSIILALVLVWFIVKPSNNVADTQVPAATVPTKSGNVPKSEEIQYLTPEQVDELLPSAPVIVRDASGPMPKKTIKKA